MVTWRVHLTFIAITKLPAKLTAIYFLPMLALFTPHHFHSVYGGDMVNSPFDFFICRCVVSEKSDIRCFAADADRKFRRAGTAFGVFRKGSFDHSVLEGME